MSTPKTQKAWSEDVAALGVDMLIDHGLVRKEDLDRATKVVAEEILVRLSIGDYPPAEESPNADSPCAARRVTKNSTNHEITERLVDIINDGFNRSLGALERAGAIETRKLQEHYRGVGSKFYDVVTEQITYTARQAAPAMRKLFSDEHPT